MLKDKIYNTLKLLLCLVFFFSISNITSLFLNVFNIDKNKIGLFGNTLYQFIVSFILFALLLILYKDTIKKDFKNLKKDFKNNIIYIIKTFLIFIIVKYLVSILSSIIMVLCGLGTENIVSVNQSILEDYIKAAPLLMLISVAFLGPFYEEGIFRLAFKKVIDNKWLYIIISGSLFGILHVFPLSDGVTLPVGIIQSISYVTMGMFFSYVYYKKDNIFFTVGLHFLNNFISVLVMLKMFF